MKNVFLFCFVLLSFSLLGQKYNTSAGVRLSNDFGISISQRIAKKHTIELLHQDGFFSNSPRMTSLTVKKHYGLLTRRFNVFLGAGGFMSGSSEDYYDEPLTNNYGIAMIAGAEMTIGRLNISADYSPNYALKQDADGPRFISSSGISLKYVLIKRKRKRKFLNKFKRKNHSKKKKSKSKKKSWKDRLKF